MRGIFELKQIARLTRAERLLRIDYVSFLRRSVFMCATRMMLDEKKESYRFYNIFIARRLYITFIIM